MKIPYRFNPFGIDRTSGAEEHPEVNSRGCFAYLSNGRLQQSAMTIRDVMMLSNRVQRIDAFSGGTVSGGHINYGCLQRVYNGGESVNVSVNYGASQSVSSGGKTIGTQLNSGGSMFVSSGGSASSTTITSSGYAVVYAGGEMISPDVMSCGVLEVRPNATLKECTLGYGASVYVSSGASVLSATLLSDFSFGCSSGIYMDGTVVSSGAYLYISSGATCTNIVLNYGGRLIHGVWGYDDKTIVTGSNVDGNFSLSGGNASGYSLDSGCSQEIYYAGTAINTIIRFGGCQIVSFYAVSEDTVVKNGGNQYVYSSGIARHTILAESDCFQSVFQYGITTSTVISAASSFQYVVDHASAYATTVFYGATQFVKNYSIAYDTVVSSGGWQFLSYGLATNTVVSNAGTLFARSNSEIASAVVLSGGMMNVENYTKLSAGHISSGGSLRIGAYNTVIGTIIETGAWLYIGDSNSVDFGGDKCFNLSNGYVVDKDSSFSGATINSNGSMLIFGGGSATDTDMVASSYMHIKSDGIANGVSVNGSNARLYISQGAQISNVTMSHYGTQYVSNRATAFMCDMKAGCLYGQGGVITSLTLSSGAYAEITSSSRVSALTISTYGSMYAASSYIDGGIMESGARLSMYYTGSASGLTVSSGASVWFFSGISAINITSKTGAYVYVENGATITYATE